MRQTNETEGRITRRNALKGLAGLGVVGSVGTTGAAATGKSRGDRRAPKAARIVRKQFEWAWKNYREYAWGHDMITPVSGGYEEFFFDRPVGLTLVEALDTLYLLGMDSELEKAVEWVEEELTFDVDADMQVFEANIRMVGGLLSGYKVTDNETLLDLAQDLADRLRPAFEESPTGMPYRFVNPATGAVSEPVNYIAEIGTYVAEWGELSREVGDNSYYELAKAAMEAAYDRRSDLDLLGASIDVETGEWQDTVARIGPPSDSFYEYLWDGWRLFGDADLLRWFGVLVDGIQEHQAERYDGNRWYRRVDMDTGDVVARTQSELSNYWSGLMAEAGQAELGRAYHDSWTAVREKFDLFPGSIDYTDLSAESTTYWLRPEYLGGALLLYERTGERAYRERAYELWRAMEEHCRVENGYTVITDVTTSPMEQGDLTPGYWWSENMKYFYLLAGGTDRLAEDYYLTTEGNVLRGVEGPVED